MEKINSKSDREIVNNFVNKAIQLLPKDFTQQYEVDCTHCGRRYKDTMCKLHPSPCKNK